jgi:serine/threonine protein kinase
LYSVFSIQYPHPLCRLAGSRRYMAPEASRFEPYGLSADVYSFSILLWEICSDKVPFSNMSWEKHFDQVVLKHKRPPPLKHLSKVLQNTMQEGWSKDREARPSFEKYCSLLSVQVMLATQLCVDHSMDARKLCDRTRHLMDRSMHSLMKEYEDHTEAVDFELQ